MADGPTARAERHDVEAFERDALPTHGAATAERGFPILDQRDVGGGAADVERDEVLAQPALSQRHARRDTARRAGQRGAGGEPRGFLDRRDAAMGEDDEDIAAVAGIRQPPA